MSNIRDGKIPPWLFLGLGIGAFRMAGCAAAGEPFDPDLSAPPDNVEVYSGTWGIDFDEDAENHLSANRSILFRATTPSNDPALQTQQFIEAIEGVPYTAEFVVQASSIAAGNTFKAEMVWFDVNKVELSTSTVHNAVLSSANAWEHRRATATAPTDARYVKLRATKKRNAFTVNLDEWSLNDAVARGHYTVSAAAIATYFGGDAPAIPFDTVTAEYGLSLNTGTGVVTVGIAGTYVMSCTVSVDDPIANGALIDALPTWNGTYLSADLRYNWSGGALSISANPHAVVSCVAGDTLEVRMIHTHGSDRDFSAALHIVRVE